MSDVFCDYCGMRAVLVTGREIYPRRPDLWKKQFWRCGPCGAHVGCHPNTESPMGRLANAELRSWKVRVHSLFDPLWQGGSMTRPEAYRWLAEVLGITTAECHVGMFDVARCKLAVAILQARSAAPPGTT